ncbi:MAG TPA: P1 family peptidase [Bryobacteraceae bacterium]|nr:P1 family peptidase [Bryobacteraceae bacterium]
MGIRVGHASDYDALTGCTVILCEAGAVGGIDIRGAATGTEEIDVLRPAHITDRVHAVVLAGGSAFGLEAASGVRRYLEHRGVGFQTGAAVVPIVPCAILYDLAIGKANVRPTREMGESAAAAATDNPVQQGAVGAGTGASVGKIFGMAQAMKSGIGSFTVSLTETVRVSALVAVNAFGDVLDPETGKLIAGARRARNSSELAGTESEMKRGARGGFGRQNTTLAVVATNARLSKVGATRLAEMANLGMARTIFPVHTAFDGDLCFALSLGNESADLNTLGVAAAEAVAKSIVLAVRNAPALGGLPGMAGPEKK